MTQSEWREIFGNNLKSILEERGMSQRDLANDTRLSTSRINEYIKGYTTPNIFAIINMAYALDIDIDEFVNFEDTIE